nr:GIY-YIG nuclease family protein [Mesorhizobium loti]
MAANPAWPGRCKVGLAKDLGNRLRQMNTNDPDRAYTFHETRSFDDRKQAEAILHELLAQHRIPGTEWFHLDPEDAASILRRIHSWATEGGRPGGHAGEPRE